MLFIAAKSSMEVKSYRLAPFGYNAQTFGYCDAANQTSNVDEAMWTATRPRGNTTE